MAEIKGWVFDLDDTLYAERDYVHSAFHFIASKVAQFYADTAFGDVLFALFEQKHAAPIDAAWAACNLPDMDLPAMISAMRAHQPLISLSDGAATVLERLRKQSQPFAIVTDGRAITQRAKITALGCDDAAFISISEEVGLAKLSEQRFLAVAGAFSSGPFGYVGDNPAKDFFAPKSLGWKTYMIDHRGSGVHPQVLPEDVRFHPDHIVTDLAEILA